MFVKRKVQLRNTGKVVPMANVEFLYSLSTHAHGAEAKLVRWPSGIVRGG